jgi:hypothetical protein
VRQWAVFQLQLHSELYAVSSCCYGSLRASVFGRQQRRAEENTEVQLFDGQVACQTHLSLHCAEAINQAYLFDSMHPFLSPLLTGVQSNTPRSHPQTQLAQERDTSNLASFKTSLCT